MLTGCANIYEMGANIKTKQRDYKSSAVTLTVYAEECSNEVLIQYMCRSREAAENAPTLAGG